MARKSVQILDDALFGDNVLSIVKEPSNIVIQVL